MKFGFPIVAAALIALTCPSNAHASTISLADNVFNPTDTFMVGGGAACTGTNGATDTVSGPSCQSILYTHTLTDFNAATDTLVSASLTFWMYDDTGTPEKTDLYSITIGGAAFATGASGIDGTSAGSPLQISFNVLSNLSGTPPQVQVFLVNAGSSSSANWDFYFDKSILSATVNRVTDGATTQVPAAVPEPASLLLLGTGLVVVASRLRRKSL